MYESNIIFHFEYIEGYCDQTGGTGFLIEI